MLLNRLILVVVTTVSALPSVAGAEADRPRSPTPAAIADSYVHCVEASDVECAVKLFHLPTSLTTAERQEELRFLERALKLFAGEFGKPRDIRTAGQPLDVAFASVGTGSLPYWEKHPDFRRFTFFTKFDRDGPGTITIDVCEIGGRPEIRQVLYGLPRSSPNTAARLTEIVGKLQAIGSDAST